MEKKMISSCMFYQAWGTAKYSCEWQGEWEAQELVNHCDGSAGNYGGRIDNLQKLDNGNYRGIVCVYYD